MGDEVMKRSFAFFLAVLILLMAMPVCSMAGSIKTGKLTVSFSFQDKPISGATFSLYTIANGAMTPSGIVFQAKDEYTPYVGKPFNTMKESEFHTLTKDAENHVKMKKVTADYMAKTDDKGQFVLNIPYGIYLVRQTGSEGQAENFMESASFLAIVPASDPLTGEMIDSKAEPKAEPSATPTPSPTPSPTPTATPTSTPGGGGDRPTPTYTVFESTPTPTPLVTATPKPEEELIDLKVRKDWADYSNSENIRPQSIMLYLFRKTTTAATYPNEPYLTVELTGYGNQWSFVFFGLVEKDINGIRYEYLVREGDVTGYSPIYETQNGNSQIITNVHPTNTPEPGTTPVPSPAPTETPDDLPRIPVGVIELDGEWYYIDEYGVPLGLVPQTGDETQLILYAGCAMLFIAAAVYLFVMLYRRRRDEA